MASMQKREPLLVHAHSNMMKKFPPMGKGSPVEASVLSKSPDHQSVEDPQMTAGELKNVEETEGASGEVVQWARRLGEMEKRQSRIESLLAQIANDIKEMKQ